MLLLLFYRLLCDPRLISIDVKEKQRVRLATVLSYSDTKTAYLSCCALFKHDEGIASRTTIIQDIYTEAQIE